ncbi:MAG: STAS domain-containing protein [Gallionellaceae bacterium]|nr:STAS domain-containing protein [Gallionellaceae bacterium]
MDIIASRALRINVTELSNTATIYLNGHFDFESHREFKSDYKGHLYNSKISNIVINLAEVKYLDSSALGMLLVLRDHVQAANKSLILSRPSPITERTLDIASFY